MKKLLLLFLLLNFGIIYSQKKPVANKNLINNKSHIEESILLISTVNDTLMTSMVMDARDNEFTNESMIVAKENGKISFSFPLSQPQFFAFYGLTPFTMPSYIYVTPGDSLTFELGSNLSIVYKGKNEAHYNFFHRLRLSGLDYPKYSETDGIWEYKKKCEEIYQRRKEFLEQYSKNEKVSSAFVKKASDALQFEYIDCFLNSYRLPPNALDNNPEYFSEINIETFNNDGMLDYYPFKGALMNYLFYASKVNDKYSENHLKQQLDLINKNLTGQVKEFAITRLLLNFNNNLTPEIIEPLKDTYTIYIPEITNVSYRNKLESTLKGLKETNTSMPNEILNSKVTDLKGNVFTINQVLNQQGKKVKVIDFWASWCGACIASIKETPMFRQKLSKDNDVVFLFFSIDKDSEKWKKKATELKVYGMEQNQYLVDEATISYIKDYFQAYAIPRYVILDHEDKMALFKAPSISDSLQFERAIEEVNKKEK